MERTTHSVEPATYPNALYALLQVVSQTTSSISGRTLLPIGPHLRHPGGLRSAVLGLAAEHGTGEFALEEVSALPTAIAISQRGVTADVTELELLSRLRHQGRSLMVTSFEARGPGRDQVLAFGTLTWAVTPRTSPRVRPPGGFTAPKCPADLTVAAGVGPGEDAYAIASPGADILGPGGVLHAGALQTLAEEAALAHAGGGPLVTADATFRFVRGARGPMTARAATLATGPDGSRDVEVEVAAEDGRVATIATFRLARVAEDG